MAFGKRCTKLFGWGLAGYFAYKAYRYIFGIINITKELPVYMKNVIGETPKMDITVVFNRMTLRLEFNAETLKDHPEIADTAIEYINRYYPIFRTDHVKIEVFEKAVEEKTEPEENKPEPEKQEVQTEE